MNAVSPSESSTPATPTPAAPMPLPNDAAARSPTGEILEPSQIAAQQAAAKPTETNPDGTPKSGETPAPTSTSKDPAAKPAEGAPETYADFTVPDGYTLDPKTVEAATPLFKELGLTQDQAQKLVSFYSEQAIAAAKAPAAEYEATRTAWKAQVDSDPVIRGATMDGKTGIEAVKIGIGKTLAAIGDPALTQEFKAAMDLTGVGDNPAFIKAMYKLSAYVVEGKHVAGSGPSVHGQTPPNQGAKPSPARALYPHLS